MPPILKKNNNNMYMLEHGTVRNGNHDADFEKEEKHTESLGT